MSNISNESNNPTSGNESYSEFYDTICVLNAVFSLTAFAGIFLALGAIWSSQLYINLLTFYSWDSRCLTWQSVCLSSLCHCVFDLRSKPRKISSSSSNLHIHSSFLHLRYNFDAHLGQRGQMSCSHTASQVRCRHHSKENSPRTLLNLASKRGVCRANPF